MLDEELNGLIFKNQTIDNIRKLFLTNSNKITSDSSKIHKPQIFSNTLGSPLSIQKKGNYFVKLIERVPPIRFISNVDLSKKQSINYMTKGSGMFIRPIPMKRRYLSSKEEKQGDPECFLGKRSFMQFERSITNKSQQNIIRNDLPELSKNSYITCPEGDLNVQTSHEVSNEEKVCTVSDVIPLDKEGKLINTFPKGSFMSRNLNVSCSLHSKKG